MNFVIPMAGRGQRFIDAGYTQPKMLIKAKGKTLLEWSVDSLPLELCTNLIFILLEEHQKFGIEELVLDKYKEHNPKFIYLKNPTRGQAETVLLSSHCWDLKRELLIYNIDTAFTSKNLAYSLMNNKSDGILGAFVDKSDSSKYSYAKKNKEDLVVEVVEKDKISNFALSGLYHFSNPQDFIKIAEKNIQEDNRVKGEFYIAPIYNQLINEGKKFILDLCDSITVLGTPEELKVFLKK
jgi:dTDP-glucose pyrophosphorylase